MPITKVTGIVLGDDVTTETKLEAAIAPIRTSAESANTKADNNRQDLDANTGVTNQVRQELDVAKADITSLQAGQCGGIVAFATRAIMNANLNYNESTAAMVMNDNAANNGYYRKLGASGSGLWVKSTDDSLSNLEALVNSIHPVSIVGGTTGSINFNMKNRTAEVKNGFDLFLGAASSHIVISPQDISLSHIPENQYTYAHYWYVEPNTQVLRVGTRNSQPPSKEAYIIGVTYLQHALGQNSYLFEMVDKFDNRLPITGIQGGLAWSGGGVLQGMVCDFKTNEVRIERTVNVYASGQNIGIPNQVIKFSDHGIKDTDGYVALMLRRYTNGAERTSIKDVKITDTFFYLVGWTQYQTTSQFMCSSDNVIAIFTADGHVQTNCLIPPRCIGRNPNNVLGTTGGTNSSYATQFGVLINPANMTLDLQTKELSVSSSETYVSCSPSAMSGGRAYFQIHPQTFDVSTLNDGWLWVIWYDWYNNKLMVTDATQTVAGSFATIIAYRWDKRMWWISNGTEQPNFIDSNGDKIDLIPQSGGGSGGSIFTEQGNRMLFPRKLFMVEGEELPVFKRSMFAKYREEDLDSMNVFMTPSMEAKMQRGQRHYRSIENELYIMPEQLGANGEIAGVRMTHVSQPDNRYNVDVTIKSADKSVAAGQSRKMLFIGDSLTEVGMANDFKNKMQNKYNCTIDVVGTYASSYTHGIASEGRGYWQYRSFIGKCNRTGAPHTLAPSGASTTGKWENPFLRLATQEDKNKNPSLCFTMTSSEVETSYADNPNLGNYYIFDFQYYFDNHGVDKPDFLTIALSTNDINLQRNLYTYDQRMFFMKEGLRLMLRSIQAASPSTKVAVIPAPISAASSTGYTRWEAENANWIYECQNICEEYGVDFLPIYLHVPRDYQNPWASNTEVAGTMMKKAVVTDWVHFDEVGRDMYCNASTAWAVNRT